MGEVGELLKKLGYSSEVIEHYLKKVNVGRIENQVFNQLLLDHATIP